MGTKRNPRRQYTYGEAQGLGVHTARPTHRSNFHFWFHAARRIPGFIGVSCCGFLKSNPLLPLCLRRVNLNPFKCPSASLKSADNRQRVGHKKCSLPLYLLPLPLPGMADLSASSRRMSGAVAGRSRPSKWQRSCWASSTNGPWKASDSAGSPGRLSRTGQSATGGEQGRSRSPGTPCLAAC